MTNTLRLSAFVISLLSGCATQPASHQEALERGNAFYNAGDFTAALQQWAVLGQTQDPTLQLHQAHAYQTLGQLREAQRAIDAAIANASQADAMLKTELLLTQSEIELMQGMKQRAVEHLQQAKTAAAGLPRLAAKLAVIEARLALIDKQLPQAAEHFALAQQLAGQLGDELLQQEMAVSRWDVLLQIKRAVDPELKPQPGLKLADNERQALHAIAATVQALPPSAGRDFVAIKLARLLTGLSDEDGLAEQLLLGAEVSCRRRDDQRLLSYALGYQGLLAERQQQTERALGFSDQAAFAAQQASALESLYLWEWQVARLLQQQNRNDSALDAYRRAVFNLQRSRADLAIGSAFRETVAPLFSAYSDLLLKQASRQPESDKAQALLREVRDVLEQQKAAELQDYFQDRCVANFKAKTKNLEAITDRTAVIYPIMLNDRSEILLGFADGLRQFVIPVGKQALTEEIHAFRSRLEKRTTFQYLTAGKQLYQWLIAPMLVELRQHKIETLVMVPDGALRSIPLAALHDGQHYLIEEFAVATTPGLALTDPHPLPREQLQVLLNGLTEATQDFPALPDVAQELDNIHRQFGGTILKDDAFSLDAIANQMQSTPYRIVHIASHGQFDRNPSKTFLLTHDDKLTMDLLERYISIGKYRDSPVELLTLSACQTAAGDDRAALGLAGVAVKAGARSALASLWFINDQASSQLISEFYRQLQQRQSKAKALQQAQLQLLADPRYRHASYWAPFLLIGNWL